MITVCAALGQEIDATTGTPGFIIPALCFAISSIVSPRIAVWSSATEVITEVMTDAIPKVSKAYER